MDQIQKHNILPGLMIHGLNAIETHSSFHFILAVSVTEVWLLASTFAPHMHLINEAKSEINTGLHLLPSILLHHPSCPL